MATESAKSSSPEIIGRTPQPGSDHQLFEVMSHMDVIWDEELLPSFYTQDGLLQHVSRSVQYLFAEERKPSAELKIHGKPHHVNDPSFILDLAMHTVQEDLEQSDVEMVDLMQYKQVVWDDELLNEQQEAGFDECLVVDTKATIDLVINDLLTTDSDMDTTDNLFNDTSIEVVVWDEEKQNMFEHHGLLKQLAQGGNYFVGEEKKLTAASPTYDVLPHVLTSSADAQEVFASISVANGLSLFLEHSVASMDQLSTEIPSEVVWDDNPNYGTEPIDVKVAGLSFHEPDTEVANIMSIPYAFSLGNIFHFRNTDNIQVSLIKQSYCDLANFGMLVWQQDAILVGHQPELGMDLVDTVFDETPSEMFVWVAGFLPDACDAHGLFNRMLYQDELWDDDPELDDLMQGKLLSEEVICDSMVWDEIQAEIGMHHGLLQRQVIGATDMENGIKLIVKLSQDEMLPVIGIFQLLQEHGIEVADQRLEQLHLQIVDFKAQMLSGCESHKHVTQLGEYLVDADIKPMAEHITIDRDTPFLLVVCMGPVDVPQVELVDFGMAMSSAVGMQGIVGAQYVIDDRPPWWQSAFSPGNDYLNAASSVFQQIPSWDSNDFSSWSSAWFSIFSLQNNQHSDHSNHQTAVMSKYDIEMMWCSGCLNVPWDPGGNHSCFILAIAWGQAMFCGGGNVTPDTMLYMGPVVRDFRLYCFGLPAPSSRYKQEEQQIEEAGYCLENRVSCGSRASSSFPRSYPSSSPVICSRRRSDLVTGNGLLHTGTETPGLSVAAADVAATARRRGQQVALALPSLRRRRRHCLRPSSRATGPSLAHACSSPGNHRPPALASRPRRPCHLPRRTSSQDDPNAAPPPPTSGRRRGGQVDRLQDGTPAPPQREARWRRLP